MLERRLQVFAAVARLLSFTKAAKALHMTQPAVTFQIRRLEEHFNARLFERAHNRIALTEAGRVVRLYADGIMAKYAEMNEAVRALTGDAQGPLAIGASTTIGEYFIPRMLGAYQAKFAGVAVRLRIANTVGIIRMLESGDIDVGMVEGPVNNKNLNVKTVWDDELVAVCAPRHALAARAQVGVADLLEYPFISREEGSGTREVMENYLAGQGVDVDDLNITMEFGSPESIKSAVAAGLGVSILSVATMEKELALNLLHASRLKPPIRRPFSLVCQRQKYRLRAVDEFIAFAQRHCEVMREVEK